MDSITQALLDSFTPEITAQRALNKLETEVNLIKFINTDYSPEVSTRGKVVKVPKYGNFQVNDKAATVEIILQDPADSEVAVTLNQHKEVSYLVEDVATAVANPGVIEGYLQNAMLEIYEAAEEYAFSVAGTLTQSIPSTVYTSANVLPAIKSARKTLTDGRAPKSNRGLFTSTEIYNTLLGTNNLAFQQNYGNNVAIADGMVPKIYGFQAYESLFTPVSEADAVTNLAIHKDALTMVARSLPTLGSSDSIRQAIVVRDGFPMRVTMSYDHKALGVIVTVDALYGASVLRDELGVKIISDESEES